MPFLTDLELNNLKSWKYKVIDESFMSIHLQRLWNWQVTFFPKDLHPNLISLAGFLCVLYGFVMVHRYEPSLFMALVMVVLSTVYTFLDALDGKQARRIHASSPVGELFDHALDNISMVLLLMSMFQLSGCTDRLYILSMIFTMSIAFLSFHLEALLSNDHTLVFGTFTGQNEGMLYYYVCILFPFWRRSANFPMEIAPYTDFIANYSPYAFVYISIIYFLVKIILCYKRWLRVKKDVDFGDAQQLHTVLGIVLTYGVRVVGAFGSNDSSLYGYLCEGFVLSIPTTEVILCKMSGKHFSPVIVVIAMASIIDNNLALIGTLGYYVYLFYTLTVKLRIPFLRPRTRVYCCGVFDMCHRGHMLLFKRTAAFGDCIVGVHSDEDVESYKRRPNVSHEERCATVAECNYVTEVIPFAPLYMDEDFLKKHRIDLVVCSDEYDSPEDKYYAVPRRMGILHVLPRTQGVSSSDMMKSIMNRKSL